MAIPVTYTPVPYARPADHPDQKTLMDLLRLASTARQQSILQRGDIQAQSRMNLGSLIGGALASIAQDRDRNAALALAKQRLSQEQIDKDQDQALRKAQFDDLAAQRAQADKEKQAALAQAGALRVGQGDPGAISEEALTAAQADPSVAQRTRYSFGPGTTEGPELLPTKAQADKDQRMAALDAVAKEQGGVVGPSGQVALPPKPVAAPREPNPTEASLALLAANGNEGAKRALAIIAQQRPKTEPIERPSIWVSKGTDTRFVTPSQAAQMSSEGWKSGNTREQGRPVTSGDAGKMADFDNSLKLLTSLGDKLGTTGAASKVGAMVPNVVTEYTGWGADAKSRQATIDQVKQIIGKALEGGVLRKEDEIKYEKILPTIGDPPPVAKAKIQGLLTTIADKRQATIDALTDAGYETSRFSARTPNGDRPLQNGDTVTIGKYKVKVEQ